MIEVVCFQGLCKKYMSEEGGEIAVGMAAVKSASTVEEAMRVYDIADRRKGHVSCCEAAFEKALELVSTDLELDYMLNMLGETGLTSYSYEV